MRGLRGRAARTAPSALAGGGLTGLGGALPPGGALGVGVCAAAPVPTGRPEMSLARSGAEQTGGGVSAGTFTTTTTSTTTTSTTTTPSPASTATGPSSSPRRAGARELGGTSFIPVVRRQRGQRRPAAAKRGRKRTHTGLRRSRRRLRGAHKPQRAGVVRPKMAPPPQLAAEQVRAVSMTLELNASPAGVRRSSRQREDER